MSAAASAMLLAAIRSCRTCSHARNAHTSRGCSRCDCDGFIDPSAPRHERLSERCRVCGKKMWADEIAYATTPGAPMGRVLRERADDENQPVHPGLRRRRDPDPHAAPVVVLLVGPLQ